MKIDDVTVRVFTYKSNTMRDVAGHSHPGPPRDARQALLTITCDDGTEGHAFASPEIIRPYIVDSMFKPALVGRDPLLRERLWQEIASNQRGSSDQLTDKAISAVDMALWDIAGKKAGMPVYRLIGAYRDKVLAYGSTMVGDDLEGGLSTPEDYGRFAEALVKRGYKAIKLHTWMPENLGTPDVKRDVMACAAVREAVGEDFPLMVDAFHWFTRTDALYFGRQLQKLNFAWFEEPMEEASMSSYAWLAANLDIPVIGPETMVGKHQMRAEWVKSGACDILRTGVTDVGGIGPALKVAHLAESFGMNCEVHGGGPANLAVVCAIRNCDYYERGLLHPFIDYDEPAAYLNKLADPMDEEGYVHASQEPGLGHDINFDYINGNLVH